ncbi:hypothetical protein FRC11_012061 [Ceratobasidium sp. 423]|nr:hypothetical protein FRC11_012061 [Ceratobasidium sp. 423]
MAYGSTNDSADAFASGHAATATNNPSATEPGSSRLSQRPREEDSLPEPSSKRRKTNSHTATPVDPASTQDQNQIPDETPQEYSQSTIRRLTEPECRIPTFMSICALEADDGIPYRHHFLDDPESFFWITLWFVTEHLDEGKQQPNPKAQALLNEHFSGEPTIIGTRKMGALMIFADPQRTKDRLAGYANKWALDPMFFQVLKCMSAFLSRFIFSSGLKQAEGSPGSVFAQFVRISLDALGSDG